MYNIGRGGTHTRYVYIPLTGSRCPRPPTRRAARTQCGARARTRARAQRHGCGLPGLQRRNPNPNPNPNPKPIPNPNQASFRLEAAQCDRGLSASGASIERLQGLALELEAAAREDPRWTGGSAVTASPLLLGKWYLDFCDAGDVRSLSLAPLPGGGRIGSIYQEVGDRGAWP